MLNFPVWKKTLIGLICALGVIYASPNFLPASIFANFSSFMPGKQMNLGLDLQGGAHLLFKVETEQAIEDKLEGIVVEIRRNLRQAKIKYTGLGVRNQAITFKITNLSDEDKARTAIRDVDRRFLIDAEDTGQHSVTLSEADWRAEIDQAVSQSIEVIRRRIDEDGTKEPLIQRQGTDRILVQVPGAEDTEEVKNKIGKTAKMNFQMVDDEHSLQEAIGGRIPAGSVLLPSVEERADGTPERMYLVKKRVYVGGESLVDAQPSFQDNQPVVSFRFDAKGGNAFGKLTSKNVGRALAIVLDDQVISAPNINGPIMGGSGIITGSFSVRESNDLALLLRAGALPAPLIILEERSVGPGLGQDSIDAGKLASIVGLLLVIVFMVLSYGRFGIMANIALVFNISLIIAVLSALQATLTLPGIAGIVLTIGMAVDANVLIFERIREEQANGRSPISAIESGYARALTTIIDSNLTTLIAATLLFAFGSGPIKGFAVTLSIGILTSMFTAIMVTRFLISVWYKRTRPKTLEI